MSVQELHSDTGRILYEVEGDEIDEDDDVVVTSQRGIVDLTRRERHVSLDQDVDPISKSPYWIRLPQGRDGIRPGDTLRLHKYGKSYVKVHQVYSDAENDDGLVLRGSRFTMSSEVMPNLEGEDNEVLLMEEIFTNSVAVGDGGFYLETFTLVDVLPIEKHTIIMTNMLRPESFQKGRMVRHFPEMAEAARARVHNVLVCRSKYQTVHNGDSSSRQTRKIQEIWSNLTAKACDTGKSIDEYRLVRCLKKLREKSLVQLEHTSSMERNGRLGKTLKRQRNAAKDGRYTAMDCFCGAGFATQGAKEAGLEVVYSFDNDASALRSYRHNHHDVNAMLMAFFGFVHKWGDRLKVDVLMLSFPCQFFAFCKTVPGKNDDANEVAMLGLGNILAKMKPRLAVIEQTNGIDRVKFRQHVTAVISGFRDNDYSVRKGVINFASLGLPSKRRRLILIGAAPGEALPPFPAPKFNIIGARPQDHLAPAVSIADTLRRVRAANREHDFSTVSLPRGTPPARPVDPRVTQAGTFTCSRDPRNRNNLHWTGTRFWTVHELLLLQGAPNIYELAPGLPITVKLRQVGNAFPSSAARAIYAECVRSLERTDREMARRSRAGVPRVLGGRGHRGEDDSLQDKDEEEVVAVAVAVAAPGVPRRAEHVTPRSNRFRDVEGTSPDTPIHIDGDDEVLVVLDSD